MEEEREHRRRRGVETEEGGRREGGGVKFRGRRGAGRGVWAHWLSADASTWKKKDGVGDGKVPGSRWGASAGREV